MSGQKRQVCAVIEWKGLSVTMLMVGFHICIHKFRWLFSVHFICSSFFSYWLSLSLSCSLIPSFRFLFQLSFAYTHVYHYKYIFIVQYKRIKMIKHLFREYALLSVFSSLRHSSTDNTKHVHTHSRKHTKLLWIRIVENYCIILFSILVGNSVGECVGIEPRFKPNLNKSFP